MIDLNKYRLKHCHKINGILFEKTQRGTTLFEFIIYKGGKTKRYIRFVTFNKETIEVLNKSEPKARIKVKFMVKSTQYTDRNNIKRWNTDLIAQEITEWKKNENKQYKKELQEKQQEEGQYQRSLFTGETGEWTT